MTRKVMVEVDELLMQIEKGFRDDEEILRNLESTLSADRRVGLECMVEDTIANSSISSTVPILLNALVSACSAHLPELARSIAVWVESQAPAPVKEVLQRTSTAEEVAPAKAKIKTGGWFTRTPSDLKPSEPLRVEPVRSEPKTVTVITPKVAEAEPTTNFRNPYHEGTEEDTPLPYTTMEPTVNVLNPYSGQGAEVKEDPKKSIIRKPPSDLPQLNIEPREEAKKKAGNDGDDKSPTTSRRGRRQRVNVVEQLKLTVDTFSEELEVLRELGRGTQAVVSLVRNEEGQVFAQKTINCDKLTGSIQEVQHRIARLKTEITVARMNCAHIVQGHGCYLDPSGTSLNILMEYMDLGDLSQVLDGTPIPEAIVSNIMFQVISGLGFLHEKHGEEEQRLMHRDLKPENVLVNSQGECKLTDFGVAKEVSSRQEMHTRIGSTAYMAPECLNEWGEYSTQADLWASGMLTFTLLIGHYPLKGLNEFRAIEVISSFSWENPKDWKRPNSSEEALDFLSKLLVANSEERLNAKEALQHSFLCPPKASCAEVAEWLKSRLAAKKSTS